MRPSKITAAVKTALDEHSRSAFEAIALARREVARLREDIADLAGKVASLRPAQDELARVRDENARLREALGTAAAEPAPPPEGTVRPAARGSRSRTAAKDGGTA